MKKNKKLNKKLIVCCSILIIISIIIFIIFFLNKKEITVENAYISIYRDDTYSGHMDISLYGVGEKRYIGSRTNTLFIF